MTGKVNSTAFHGWKSGEVMFPGAGVADPFVTTGFGTNQRKIDCRHDGRVLILTLGA